MTTESSAQTTSIPPLVIRSAIVASLGGLLFGFDTAVISGAEEKLTELYALSSLGEGMIVAIATIGTICGAIVAGNLADRFGRKPILFWIGVLFGVGALRRAGPSARTGHRCGWNCVGLVLLPDHLLHGVPLPRRRWRGPVFRGRAHLHR